MLLRCHGIIAEGVWGFYGVTRVFWVVVEGLLEVSRVLLKFFGWCLSV